MVAATLDYHKTIGNLCRKSFYHFVKHFWGTIIEEEPEWNWHIKYLCDEIQKMLERVFNNEEKEYDLFVNISPGETKSTIFSILLTPWAWTRMPSFRSINGSYADDLSLEMSRKARDVIQSEKYQSCFPEVRIRSDMNTKSNFVNTRGGQRIATSTGAGITGKHAHVIIIDDPLNPKQAASDIELEKANSWMTETLPSRKVNKAVTPMMVIMQRLHQNDPTGNRLKKAEKNPDDRVKNIRLPATTEYTIKPSYLKKFYKDGLMNPARTNRKVLAEVKATSGEAVLACQYGQDPRPRGGGMFRRDRVKIERVVPNNFKRVIRYWDKAGTFDGGCYTVGLKIGLQVLTKGLTNPLKLFWILDVVRFQEAAFERERIILTTAQSDGIDVEIFLEEEGGSGGKESVQNSINNLAGFKVRRDKPVGDKEVRADPASVQWNNYCFRMIEAHWNQDFLDELEYFPRSTYKDQVDALSGGFAALTAPRLRLGAW
jgi:predicted phage terminase large subunit-like protein